MLGLKRDKESIEKQVISYKKVLASRTPEYKAEIAKKAVITRTKKYDFGKLISEGKKANIKLDWDNKQTKPVKQLDLEGNIIKIWASAYQAQKEAGLRSSSISRICHGGVGLKTYKGFKWEFLNSDIISKSNKQNRSKK